LWQIVRKPELSRLSRIEMPRTYPSKQNRLEKLSVDHRPIIEQLKRGLASLRSPFELRIARAQAVLAAIVEMARLVSEDNIEHPNRAMATN
jgi:hypothetical protein